MFLFRAHVPTWYHVGMTEPKDSYGATSTVAASITGERQAFRDGVRMGLFAYDMADDRRRAAQAFYALTSVVAR